MVYYRLNSHSHKPLLLYKILVVILYHLIHYQPNPHRQHLVGIVKINPGQLLYFFNAVNRCLIVNIKILGRLGKVQIPVQIRPQGRNQIIPLGFLIVLKLLKPFRHILQQHGRVA